MSKYIDAEFEIDHYTSMTTHPTPDVTEQDKRNSLIILDALRMAKSIDIVHCGECKWRKTDNSCDLNCRIEYLDGTETDVWFYVKPDDFCSYGERSE